MSSRKSDRRIMMSFDELDDVSLEDQTPPTPSSQTIFKKKGIKGNKLNQRKIALDFDASDEELEQKPVFKKTKFKSPHSFIAKRQASRTDADHNPVTEAGNNNIKYTPEHIRELQGKQKEKNEDIMDIDEPVVIDTTPADVLQEFHKNATIDNDNDNDEDENIIPINEYGSDDNDNDNDLAVYAGSTLPADDDLMLDNDDAFIDDGPLNLAASKRSQRLDIDKDLYDMELHIQGEEESAKELDVSKSIASKVLEPISIREHLENLKKSIEKLRTEKLETELQYTKLKAQVDDISRHKENLLLELVQ